jgi:hypothetical protein
MNIDFLTGRLSGIQWLLHDTATHFLWEIRVAACSGLCSRDTGQQQTGQ